MCTLRLVIRTKPTPTTGIHLPVLSIWIWDGRQEAHWEALRKIFSLSFLWVALQECLELPDETGAPILLGVVQTHSRRQTLSQRGYGPNLLYLQKVGGHNQAERGEVTCLGLHSRPIGEPEIDFMSPESQASILLTGQYCLQYTCTN